MIEIASVSLSQFLSMKLASFNPLLHDFGLNLDALMVRPLEVIIIIIIRQSIKYYYGPTLKTVFMIKADERSLSLTRIYAGTE